MAKIQHDPAINMSNVPIFFADQAAGLAVSAHVSKLTFGVQEDDGAEFPRPVVTIAIPTAALLDLVSDLRLILEDENFRRDVSQQLERSKSKLIGGIKLKPSPHLVGVAVKKSKPAKKAISAK